MDVAERGQNLWHLAQALCPFLSPELCRELRQLLGHRTTGTPAAGQAGARFDAGGGKLVDLVSVALTGVPPAWELLQRSLGDVFTRLVHAFSWDRNREEVYLGSLDRQSRRLLWFLACNRHASIQAMAAALGVANHFEILRRLREVINPAAIACLGRPVAEFRQRALDPVTGEVVLFNWWYTGAGGEEEPSLADVFDEGDYLSVFLRVPGDFDVGPVETTVNNGVVEIRLNRRERERHGCGN